MDAKIRFQVQTPVLDELRPRLKEIGVCRQENNLEVWEFPAERIGEAEALLAAPVRFARDDITNLLDPRAPPRTKIIEPEPYKGKSGLTVEETPMVYILRWWEKTKKTGKPEPHIKQVPRELVVLLREAIRSLQSSAMENGDIPFSKTTEKVCQLLGIGNLFLRKNSDLFDSEIFYGTRRYYNRYYDYPMTVLQTLKELIRHPRGGIEIVELRPVDPEMAERIRLGKYEEIKRSIDQTPRYRQKKKEPTAKPEPKTESDKASETKIYKCQKCGAEIDENQALRTNKIIGRQLCKKCEREFTRSPWDS